jgi:glycosyltransferase involved in cell wall biosynthesis
MRDAERSWRTSSSACDVGARVTVVIPTCNRAELLPAVVNSALDQGLPDIRVLVSDNASIDDTSAVVAALTDPRIDYVRRTSNLGWVGNFNAALNEVVTPFVTILNDDDLMVSGALERALAMLESHPRVGMVHAAHDSMGSDGVVFERDATWAGDLRHDIIESGQQFIRRSLRQFVRVCPPTVVFRTAALPPVPYRPEDGDRAVDTLYLRIALRWDVGYLATAGAVWRVHPGQSSLSDNYIAPDGAWALRDHAIDEMRAVKLRFLQEHASDLENVPQLRRGITRFVDVSRVGQARAEWSAGRLAVLRKLAESARLSPTIAVRPETWRLVLRTLAGNRGVAWFRRHLPRSRSESPCAGK